jgi:hypothetical protein
VSVGAAKAFPEDATTSAASRRRERSRRAIVHPGSKRRTHCSTVQGVGRVRSEAGRDARCLLVRPGAPPRAGKMTERAAARSAHDCSSTTARRRRRMFSEGVQNAAKVAVPAIRRVVRRRAPSEGCACQPKLRAPASA